MITYTNYTSTFTRVQIQSNLGTTEYMNMHTPASGYGPARIKQA
jgi:hypothetical protein